MRQILKKMLTASIRDSKIFKCKMITIPLEESARFAQQSPAWGTQEWEEIYCPARNAIESKNSYTKDRAIALDNKNRRFVRGGAATFMMIAFGAVPLNVNLIQPLNTRVSDPTYNHARLSLSRASVLSWICACAEAKTVSKSAKQRLELLFARYTELTEPINS
ncbi:MAG: hypothetical protein SOR94_07700 [Lawsonella sp.]|uniref:hypothetical protein n=1 Tax=Lawsonella sp. TaxID=2041415 RepID=UPI002A75EB99|nr:hypothetical protein [Lawsonella sp.]MDY2979895.1 hypothetical protein [Lawsonella sp.]